MEHIEGSTVHSCLPNQAAAAAGHNTLQYGSCAALMFLERPPDAPHVTRENGAELP